jgi:energy-coupling factor transporter transmembrane protein EcfT
VNSSSLLRYVPGDSPVHRLWTGSKMLVLAALAALVIAVPTWPVIIAVAVVVAAATVAARLPRRWLPRPPWWLGLIVLLPVAIAALRGGPPRLELLGQHLGTGGLLVAARGTFVALLFVYTGLLFAATTPAADVPAALARLLSPARRTRLPVDDVVIVTGLAIRTLPLLLDDVTQALVAWRLRVPPNRRLRLAPYARFFVASFGVAIRRAREMGEAMQARGGPAAPSTERPALGVGDILAFAATLACIAVAVLT